MLLSEAMIENLLVGIEDPLSKKPLSNSPALDDIAIKDRMVQISLNISHKTHLSLYQPIAKMVEDKLNGLDEILSVTVVMTAEATSKPAEQAAPHQQQKNHDQAHDGAGQKKDSGIAKVKKIIAIASGKGGVGKSTTAINLAYALKEFGLKVGLLDADIYGPSLPRMLGKKEAPKTADNRTMLPINAGGIKAMSIGFVVPEDEPVIWRGPMVMGALNQMLNDVIWGELDILVVDMPPGTGDAQLTLTQQVPLAGAVIVSTPQDIALLDARKGLNMFRKTDVPVLGLIENMALFICPNCNHESHIFGHGGARAEAAKLGAPFLGEIPLEIDIRIAADQGHAIVLSKPESSHAQHYKVIAKQIKFALFGDQDGEGINKGRQKPKITMH